MNQDEDDEQLESESPGEYVPIRPRRFGDMLGLFRPPSVDVRGQDAYTAAVKFFELLQEEVKDPEWQKKLLQAWISAVRNRNHARFSKEFRRWKRSLNSPEVLPTSMNTSNQPNEENL